MQNEVGKGAFQELDQVKAVQQFCKYAGQASSSKDIVPTVTAAVKVSLSHLPFELDPPLQFAYGVCPCGHRTKALHRALTY